MNKQVNITELRIGRNIDGHLSPMDRKRWCAFIAAAETAAYEFAADVEANEYWVENYYSDGDCTGEAEDIAVITVYWTAHGLTTASFDQWAVDELTRKAGLLAAEFKRAMVAVVHGGRRTLVEATEVK